MPNFPTFPTLIDELLQISLSDFKIFGYLEANTSKGGTINWKRNGETTNSISVESNLLVKGHYFILFKYNYQGESRRYQIKLVSRPSNLGKGSVLYFQCPYTQKKCRKLYLIDGYFVHRTAAKDGMYSKQTRSKEITTYDKLFGSIYKVDEAYAIINAKHFRSHYNGKPTKRYLKALKVIQEYENVDVRAYERALMFGVK